MWDYKLGQVLWRRRWRCCRSFEVMWPLSLDLQVTRHMCALAGRGRVCAFTSGQRKWRCAPCPGYWGILCIPGSRRRPEWLKCEMAGRVVHGGAGEVSRARARPDVHCWVFITRPTQSITGVLVEQRCGLFSIFKWLLWTRCGRERRAEAGKPLELFCVCPEGWWQLVWRECRRTLASSLWSLWWAHWTTFSNLAWSLTYQWGAYTWDFSICWLEKCEYISQAGWS